MGSVLLPVRALEACHDLLHVLDGILAGDEQRVGSVDDDEVGDSDCGHHPVFAADVGVADALHDCFAVHHVARRVLVGERREARP